MFVSLCGHAVANDSGYRKLGIVIASEEACDLSFDQSALRAYIGNLKLEDAAEYLQNLEIAIRAARSRSNRMKGSQKLTHCLLTERSAKDLGFLK